MRSGRTVALVLVLVGHSAAADPQLRPITNRSYSIDLYEGFALGSSALVAMGGAGAADAIGSSGTLINASASAVRQTTDRDPWSWDYHLDYLDGSLSTDYDNAHVPIPDGTSERALTGGLSVRVHDWAGAITVTPQTRRIAGSGGSEITAQGIHSKLAVARWVPELDLALGVALQVGQFQLLDGSQTLFSLTGTGLEAGAQWIPAMQSFRLGISASTSARGGNVTADSCNPDDCRGYILPEQVRVPWRVVAGVAYRWAPSAWNQLVQTHWRDERAVTLVADFVLTGASPNAYGLQAFGLHELERSGRHTSWSLRGGAQYDWLPGRLRVRAGTYWEPGRFVGVDGRLHGTFGIEVRVFAFHLWGPRRGKITLTGDLASQYRNGGISIGFWN